ncbi:unnamed protein product [Cercospora beticola]|nr:unnamed protein product [Cercospora beticola]
MCRPSTLQILCLQAYVLNGSRTRIPAPLIPGTSSKGAANGISNAPPFMSCLWTSGISAMQRDDHYSAAPSCGLLLHWQSYTPVAHWQFGEHGITTLVVAMLMLGPV